MLSGEPAGEPAGTIILPLGGLWDAGCGEPLVLLWNDGDLRTRILLLLDSLECSRSASPTTAAMPNAWFEGSDEDVVT